MPGGTTMRGRPVSGGRGRGPAAALDSADVVPGAVVVVTDASARWTPAIVTAAAVVAGHGGALAPAATVAREHGVPMVAGVGDEVRLIVAGDTIEVDGDAGLVVVRPGRLALRT